MTYMNITPRSCWYMYIVYRHDVHAVALIIARVSAHKPHIPSVYEQNTVNSLLLVGINVCVFETKPCSRGLIFAVSSGSVNYLTHEFCLRVFISQFKDT